MRTKILLVLIWVLSMVSGCGGNGKSQVPSREQQARAADLCKRDKGLRQVLDASGVNFTAECKSGIIVTGFTEK